MKRLVNIRVQNPLILVLMIPVILVSVIFIGVFGSLASLFLSRKLRGGALGSGGSFKTGNSTESVGAHRRKPSGVGKEERAHARSAVIEAEFKQLPDQDSN